MLKYAKTEIINYAFTHHQTKMVNTLQSFLKRTGKHDKTLNSKKKKKKNYWPTAIQIIVNDIEII